MVKNLPANARDVGSIPGWGRSPGGGNGNPLQYSCLFQGQRSLAVYSPWGCKELDTSERSQHMQWYGCHTEGSDDFVPGTTEFGQEGASFRPLPS